MQPIINPMFFYVASVLNAIKTIFIIGMVLEVTAIIVTFFYVMEDIRDKNIFNRGMKIVKKALIILIITIITIIFIPSKETLIQMQMAKMGTKENIEYIIKGVGKIKEELKKDVKEIIRETKGE